GRFVLVEDCQIVLAGHVLLDIAVGVEDRDRLAVLRIAVGPPDHPIADVVGKQGQPFVKPPLGEQSRLAIEELLGLADHIGITHAPAPRLYSAAAAVRPASWPQSAASITSAQRP